MRGQAPSAKTLERSTKSNAALALASARGSRPVASYSRTAAIASHSATSLPWEHGRLEQGAGYSGAVETSARITGTTLGSRVVLQRRYSAYVSESTPQS